MFKICLRYVNSGCHHCQPPPLDFGRAIVPRQPLKPKVMFKFVKSFEVQFPVWVDGVKTDETEPRVKVLFYEESEFNGLYRRKYGSAVTTPGLTTEQVNAMWDTEVDYSANLKMLDVEGSDFGKVVPR